MNMRHVDTTQRALAPRAHSTCAVRPPAVASYLSLLSHTIVHPHKHCTFTKLMFHEEIRPHDCTVCCLVAPVFVLLRAAACYFRHCSLYKQLSTHCLATLFIVFVYHHFLQHALRVVLDLAVRLLYNG